MYHLSFDNTLEGEWFPKQPDNVGHVKSNYTEKSTPRICVSPSLSGCFQAIYPNISHLIDVDSDDKHKLKWIKFYVYSPIIKEDTVIWTPSYLTSNRIVVDAHITKEYDILTPVYMMKVGSCKIQQIPSSVNFEYFHAYNDPSEEQFDYPPSDVISIKTNEKYPYNPVLACISDIGTIMLLMIHIAICNDCNRCLMLASESELECISD